MSNSADKRFAVLIDADNVSEKYIQIIVDETSNYGIATYKRIYGDWTSPRLASWKSCLLDHSILPMQQYSYTSGKNATDSAMIIDAMDILYSGTVDGFVIVSSDSDFTRLVARLRESGMQVMGMGEQKTPKPFISACNQFKYLDVLLESREAAEAEERDQVEYIAPRDKLLKKSQVGRGADISHKIASTRDKEPSANSRHNVKQIRRAIGAIIDAFSDDDGWITLSVVGDQLGKRFPDFDVRNYGYKNLWPFLKSLGSYEFDRKPGSGGSHQIKLKLK